MGKDMRKHHERREKFEQCGVDDIIRELAFCWTIFEKASEGIMCYPVNGDRMSMVNEACARMHGYSREEMQKMKLQDLHVAGLPQLSSPRIRRLLAGEHLTFEVEHYHKDSHILLLEVSSTVIFLPPMNEQETSGRMLGALTEFVASIEVPEIISDLLRGDKFILEFQRDIMERKKMAAAILDANVSESLGVMAGSIAHQLNNLLQGVLGNIAMARLYTPETSQALKFLKNAENSHTMALQLKKQLVAFATAGSAVGEKMAAGELFKGLDLFPPGGSPTEDARDCPDPLPGKREKEAAENLAVQYPASTGARILVMDDEPAVLAVATEFLHYIGYRVDGVVNGHEAIQAYQRAAESGDPYGAVILDLFIDAGMGGKEAIERLREFDPQVKAIISSGHARDPLITNYVAYGFAASLLKPYRLRELQDTLASML